MIALFALAHTTVPKMLPEKKKWKWTQQPNQCPPEKHKSLQKDHTPLAKFRRSFVYYCSPPKTKHHSKVASITYHSVYECINLMSVE